MHDKEIDFVAQRDGEKVYIQVAYDIGKSGTLDRELSSLLDVRDAYPKILITRTRQPEYNHEGVKIIDIADWLLEK